MNPTFSGSKTKLSFILLDKIFDVVVFPAPNAPFIRIIITISPLILSSVQKLQYISSACYSPCVM